MQTAQIVEQIEPDHPGTVDAGPDRARPARREATVAQSEPFRRPGIGRSLIAARRWLALPVILGILGLGAGLVAGFAARPSAQALLVVETTAADAAEYPLKSP